MSRREKWIASGLSIAVFFAIAAGVGLSTRQSALSKDMIPPEFGEFKGPLLIISNGDAWDKAARNAFEENYRGAFSFVETEDLDEKYPDKDSFRFCLNRDLFDGPDNAGTETMWILDRAKMKKYYSNRTSFAGKLLMSYSVELEKVRKK